jgi:hypothetical protein
MLRVDADDSRVFANVLAIASITFDIKDIIVSL